MYTPVSVPKKSANAGRPKGKLAYIMIFDYDDIEEYTRDASGVRVTALTFKADKKPIAVYATDSTIKGYHTSEGDDDARGFIHHVEFEHPGCFQWFKDTKMKANHNLLVVAPTESPAVSNGSKILK